VLLKVMAAVAHLCSCGLPSKDYFFPSKGKINLKKSIVRIRLLIKSQICYPISVEKQWEKIGMFF